MNEKEKNCEKVKSKRYNQYRSKIKMINKKNIELEKEG